MTTHGLPAPGERLPETQIGPFDAAALARYADVSGDHNPLHLDDALARSLGLPAPPVHGMKLLAAFEPMLAAWRSDLALTRLSGKFIQPVFCNEKVILSGRVLRASRAEGVLLRLFAHGGARVPAIIAEASLIAPELRDAG
ncbi:MAG: MaoC family dehydratase [Methylocystis sp.]|nr:MaoC family dehydratase [Methylocystis sp.]MBI3275662.1 MaoC family dehydratase [Methylocystis sp.]